MKKEFTKGRFFSYNLSQKRNFVIYTALISIFVLGLVLFYIFKLKDSNLFFVRWLNPIISHISKSIESSTLIGSLYASLFGGLFFMPIPLEILFTKFLKSGNITALIVLFYMIGLILSYTINYFVGGRLTKLSKKIITTKKFYKIKGFINRYGAWAIFGFNVLPLPSQILATILGVFNYNKPRFYLLFISGQLVKYSLIAIGYFYIF